MRRFYFVFIVAAFVVSGSAVSAEATRVEAGPYTDQCSNFPGKQTPIDLSPYGTYRKNLNTENPNDCVRVRSLFTKIRAQRAPRMAAERVNF